MAEEKQKVNRIINDSETYSVGASEGSPPLLDQKSFSTTDPIQQCFTYVKSIPAHTNDRTGVKKDLLVYNPPVNEVT